MEDVWERLVGQGGEPALTDEQREELDRRIAELDRDPGVAIPWDEVKAKALERLRK